jgi:hypothetical protein
MGIAVARKSDNPELVNGYGEVEWLPGTDPLVRGYKCLLQKGYNVSPKTYSKKQVIYIFSSGTGYITTPEMAYNIQGLCFFLPNFEKEEYKIYATSDMEYMMVVVDMLDSDVAAIDNFHLKLPFFRTLDQCIPYLQNCKGPHTMSWSVIPSGDFARVLMGVVKGEGEGTDEKGHPSVDQWNYTLPGSDFDLTAGNETIHHTGEEWSRIPTGVDHKLIAKPGKLVYYVWFEHKTEEIPAGRH